MLIFTVFQTCFSLNIILNISFCLLNKCIRCKQPVANPCMFCKVNALNISVVYSFQNLDYVWNVFEQHITTRILIKQVQKTYKANNIANSSQRALGSLARNFLAHGLGFQVKWRGLAFVTSLKLTSWKIIWGLKSAHSSVISNINNLANKTIS